MPGLQKPRGRGGWAPHDPGDQPGGSRPPGMPAEGRHDHGDRGWGPGDRASPGGIPHHTGKMGVGRVRWHPTRGGKARDCGREGDAARVRASGCTAPTAPGGRPFSPQRVAYRRGFVGGKADDDTEFGEGFGEVLGLVLARIWVGFGEVLGGYWRGSWVGVGVGIGWVLARFWVGVGEVVAVRKCRRSGGSMRMAMSDLLSEVSRLLVGN